MYSSINYPQEYHRLPTLNPISEEATRVKEAIEENKQIVKQMEKKKRVKLMTINIALALGLIASLVINIFTFWYARQLLDGAVDKCKHQ